MEDLEFLLNILKVKTTTMCPFEKNALLLYVVDRSKIEDNNLTHNDHVKLDRLMDTIAYIMEQRVLEGEETTVDNNILAMGWFDEFAMERIRCFKLNDGSDWWSHRNVSEWAKDWLSSIFADYLYTYYEKDLPSTQK